jgi:hypothetical protein
MARISSRLAALAIAALLIGTQPALAGPPLLCHPFDIGSARSLPWDPAGAWSKGDPAYNVKNLVADTEALLTPSTPVIVRMETLRRAALYASRDAQIAKQLLTAINARATSGVGASNANPLAFFDAGYLTETFRQITMLEGEREFREGARALRAALNGTDGYSLVKKTLIMRPNDPAIEFAAALIARGTRQASFTEHAAKARQGAERDALLARNISQLAQ